MLYCKTSTFLSLMILNLNKTAWEYSLITMVNQMLQVEMEAHR